MKKVFEKFDELLGAVNELVTAVETSVSKSRGPGTIEWKAEAGQVRLKTDIGVTFCISLVNAYTMRRELDLAISEAELQIEAAKKG